MALILFITFTGLESGGIAVTTDRSELSFDFLEANLLLSVHDVNPHDMSYSLLEVLDYNLRRNSFFWNAQIILVSIYMIVNIWTMLKETSFYGNGNPFNFRVKVHGVGAEDVRAEIITDHVYRFDTGA